MPSLVVIGPQIKEKQRGSTQLYFANIAQPEQGDRIQTEISKNLTCDVIMTSLLKELRKLGPLRNQVNDVIFER